MSGQHTWMAISGACGLFFFLIANFTKAFQEARVAAAMIQIGINAFVFITWGNGFLHSAGFARFVAFWGVIVPVVMASITTYRVLLPLLIGRHSRKKDEEKWNRKS